MTEKMMEHIKKFSDANLDEYVRTSSFNEELMEAVRRHIHLQLQSWYFYRKMSADCSRANVALHGFAVLWHRRATECFADANWLEKYLIQRGGCAMPGEIPAPQAFWPDNPVEPVQPVHEALQVEKRLLEDCLRLCAMAEKNKDNALKDMIETRFLFKETRQVKDMGDLLQQCVRVSKQPGHGLYHLDKEIRCAKGRTPWSEMNDPDHSDYQMRMTADCMGSYRMNDHMKNNKCGDDMCRLTRDFCNHRC